MCHRLIEILQQQVMLLPQSEFRDLEQLSTSRVSTLNPEPVFDELPNAGVLLSRKRSRSPFAVARQIYQKNFRGCSLYGHD